MRRLRECASSVAPGSIGWNSPRTSAGASGFGSSNFDMRSFHLNTEVGIIIDSPELARQAIARFDAITIPANSYAVKLATSLGEPTVHWVTEQDGKMVELDEEPGHAFMRELLVGAVSILPIDGQL